MASMERKNGAGAMLGSVLEQRRPAPTPHNEPPDQSDEPETSEPITRGRGASASRSKAQSLAARQAKRVKGRTIYLPDDLFERIMVQAHRREMTISDYVASILARQVPDHRNGRGEVIGGEG